ncbi:MAG: hypothetical protein LBM19_00585 [Holosporales bacterium]|jgi:hypothetical protein|nr:hypothetical protein [Holosporales bacterium]
MSIFRIFIYTTTFASLAFFEESHSTVNMIIPGQLEQNMTAIEDYVAPFEKFGEVGFLTNDRRLKYSIKSSLTNVSATPLEWLRALSDNHWIALNKRDLTFAKEISLEMGQVLLGKYGVCSVYLSQGLADKFSELRFRCVEQIAFSFWDCPDFDVKTLAKGIAVDDVSLMNLALFESMYELASKVTCSPLLFQAASYNMLQSRALPVANRHLIEPLLLENMELIERILETIAAKYPSHRDTIFRTYDMKKAVYARYLQHVYNMLGVVETSDCRIVDKGETSDGHSGACMFNSCFSLDVGKHNIPSTKIGSIARGQEYLRFLTTSYSDIETARRSVLASPSGIKATFAKLSSNRAADASYSFVSEIYDDVIFPGVLSDGSSTEVQCHSLGMNLAIFPKFKIREAGDSLLSHYGTGYLGSDNFPIVPISCSLKHAQLLIHV